MVFRKPLYNCTHSFLCISLDGSQRVGGGQGEEVNQGDSALDPSLSDHYASRAQLQEQVPGIMRLNLLQFASDFYITKGEVRKRTAMIIAILNLKSQIINCHRKSLTRSYVKVKVASINLACSMLIQTLHDRSQKLLSMRIRFPL